MPSNFVNCWTKTSLLDCYTCDCDEPEEEDPLTDELNSMPSRLHASNPMLVEELHNPPEDNVIDEPTDEEFCAGEDDCHLVHGNSPIDTETTAENESDGDDLELDLSEIMEHLKWVAKNFDLHFLRRGQVIHRDAEQFHTAASRGSVALHESQLQRVVSRVTL